jgi:hypothetical protein
MSGYRTTPWFVTCWRSDVAFLQKPFTPRSSPAGAEKYWTIWTGWCER